MKARARGWLRNAACTEHHEQIVKPDAIDLVPRLIRHFDEPFADARHFTFPCLSARGAEVKVVS